LTYEHKIISRKKREKTYAVSILNLDSAFSCAFIRGIFANQGLRSSTHTFSSPLVYLDFAVRYTKSEEKVCVLDRNPWLAKMR